MIKSIVHGILGKELSDDEWDFIWQQVKHYLMLHRESFEIKRKTKIINIIRLAIIFHFVFERLPKQNIIHADADNLANFTAKMA